MIYSKLCFVRKSICECAWFLFFSPYCILPFDLPRKQCHVTIDTYTFVYAEDVWQFPFQAWEKCIPRHNMHAKWSWAADSSRESLPWRARFICLSKRVGKVNLLSFSFFHFHKVILSHHFYFLIQIVSNSSWLGGPCLQEKVMMSRFKWYFVISFIINYFNILPAILVC